VSCKMLLMNARCFTLDPLYEYNCNGVFIGVSVATQSFGSPQHGDRLHRPNTGPAYNKRGRCHLWVRESLSFSYAALFAL
jgi:hypothetical protein